MSQPVLMACHACDAVLRAIRLVRPWGMIEVFMLGILVTIVKMVSLARVVPDAALTLMMVVVVMFDPRALWDMADELRGRAARSRRPFRRRNPQ